MEKIVKLYDPYLEGRRYGHRSVIEPLPKSIEKIVNELNGKKVNLKDAIEEIILASEGLGGKAEIDDKHKAIFFYIGPYSYKLFSYR
jgi:hypothetical protein